MAARSAPAASVTVTADCDSVSPAASSSATVSVTLAGPVTPPALAADPATAKVLSGASTELSTAVMVTVPVLVLLPAAMVSVALAERVTSPAEAPWLGTTDTVTVVASAEARSSAAVTVLVPPFSAMETEDRASVTAGSSSSSVTFTATEPVTSA